ncbi:MAG: MFS transporter [Holophagaceae bacterium]|nr:MFS transporter [Holophagaceae bacterium]
MSTDKQQPKSAPFSCNFWSANVIQIFERASYYGMASFVVIYLGQLGFGNYWPSLMNSLLWGIIYFLPTLAGAIADRIRFKRALLLAFILLSLGYFAMGYPVWFGGELLAIVPGNEVTVPLGSVIPVCLGVLFIGVGASFVRPSIAGTIQKTVGSRITLGFAIFFMIIQFGNLFGRIISYKVRNSHGFDLSSIFLVSMVATVIAFFLVIIFYRDTEIEMANIEKKASDPIADIILTIKKSLTDLRLVLFLIITSGFYVIFAQIYNLLPLYTKKTVELTPAMDIYTVANPIVIITCQLLFTKIFGKFSPIKSIFIGTAIAGASMLVNIFPLYMAGGVTQIANDIIPLGSIFIVLTVALIGFGEIFTSGRMWEYLATLAPKGQEGLYQGFANLPIALGSIAGGFLGAWLFNEIMCKKATILPDGLLQLNPQQASLGWIILACCGFASAVSMFLYNRWISKQISTK